MRNSVRKIALATHITFSVGWIGAACAYLVLVAAAMATRETQTLRAAWLAMSLIGWCVLVPFALASLLTGLVMSLGTPWGLFRHYWVLISLGLTLFASAVLLQHMQTVSVFARLATAADPDVASLRGALRGELLHAGVGLLVLLAIELLNVYKPQGLTAYGRRTASQLPVNVRSTRDLRPSPDRASGASTPRWVQAVGLHAVALALLLMIAHVARGGLLHH